jgi:hypothetical protein
MPFSQLLKPVLMGPRFGGDDAGEIQPLAFARPMTDMANKA